MTPAALLDYPEPDTNDDEKVVLGQIPGYQPEQTLTGYTGPRTPALVPYPEYREHGDRPRDYLLTVALAARADHGPLVADLDLLRDVLRDYEGAADQLTDEYAYSDGCTQTLAQTEARLMIAQGVAEAARRELDVAHQEVEALRLQMRVDRESVV